MSLSAGSAVLAVVAIAALGSVGANAQSGRAGSGAPTQAVRMIASEQTCVTCTIRLDTVAVLRLPSDSLSFGYETNITAVRNGFLARGLTETPAPALFDTLGRFNRLLARQGTGPGEVTSVELVVVAPGDSVWVVGSRRRLIFDREMHFVRQDRFPSVLDAIPLPSGAAIVAARGTTPASAGFPLHIVDREGSITRSFGTAVPSLDPRELARTGDSRTLRTLRHLTPGDRSTFWAFNMSRFLLEQYDHSGQLLNHGRHLLDGWYADASREEPSPGENSGFRLYRVASASEENMIWLVYMRRNASFRQPTDEERKTAIPYAGMYDLVVEALDTRSFRVVASRSFAGITARTIENGPDLLALPVPRNAYFLDYVILRMSVQPR